MFKCSVIYTSSIEGPANPCYLFIRYKLALQVSFSSPSPSLAASTQVELGKVQGTTYVWIRTHFRCPLQPEFPLCRVPPKSANCLLDLLYWYYILIAMADFPRVSFWDAWTLRVNVREFLSWLSSKEPDGYA